MTAALAEAPAAAREWEPVGTRGREQGPDVGGEGGTVRPPELRDLAFPFDNPPKELRGASLNVTFWVRNDGRVDRYEVVPAIADRDYARKFDEVIRAFRFTPARAAGRHQGRRHDHGHLHAAGQAELLTSTTLGTLSTTKGA